MDNGNNAKQAGLADRDAGNEAKRDSAAHSTAAPPAELPVRERRRAPRISETPPTPPPPPRLDDYEPIIGRPELDELRFLARQLRGKTVKMVNSTAVGGGVAEILNRLVPLMNELEVHTR